MGAVSTSAPRVGRRGGGGRGPSSAAREERRLAAFMVAPSILVIAVVAAYPIGYAIWLSLHEYSIRVAGLSRWAGDRKSTRLNSSHANISYAVFCLQKKNQNP